eukprot:TRINITY_DN105089_c1_g1_i1.p1 TRINITY_DN105089_c1_g1~~TRINITY_DN105089_c1_g1_i1.p1  ORF type:complete len:922 (-),score=52.36 TRINITY_DN105089_c1_g1_i1:1192-3957(-)
MEPKPPIKKLAISFHLLLLYALFSLEATSFAVVTFLYHLWASIPFCAVTLLPLLYEWKWILSFLNLSHTNTCHSTNLIALYTLKALFSLIAYSYLLDNASHFVPLKLAFNTMVLLYAISKPPRFVLALGFLNVLGVLWYLVKLRSIEEGFLLAFTQTAVIVAITHYLERTHETTLSGRQKTLKDFIMSLPEAIVILDRDNSVAFKNEEAFEFFDKLKGSHNGSFGQFTELLVEANNSGTTLKQNIEQFCRDIEGTYQYKMQWTQDYLIEEVISTGPETSTPTRKEKRHLNVTMIWTKDSLLFPQEGGELSLIFNDISEKGALREQKLADNMKSVLISTISHELRTPLNGVIGILNVICEKLPSEIKAWWNAAYISTQLLLNTVNCMLDFSQLEMQKFALHTGILNIRATFTELLVLFEDIVPKDKVVLKQEVIAEVPVSFRTDPARVKQILMNLLSNSVNYTFNGSISLAASMVDDEFMKIEVTDTGVGISKEAQQNLFKLFGNVQNETSVNACKLAGLGLTVSNKLVHELGGTMAVKSSVNIGSKFTFTLKELPPESPKPLPRQLRNGSVGIKPAKCRNASTSEMKLMFDCKPEQRRSTLRNILLNKSLTLRNGGLNLIPRLMPCMSPNENVKKKLAEDNKSNSSISESESDSDSSPSSKSDNSEGSVCEELKLSGDIMESVKYIHRSISKSEFSFDIGTRKSKALSADLTKAGRKLLSPSEIEILVVDDSSINRLVLSGMLKNLGYTPKEACNGKEACKIVIGSGARIDIVLMDVQMPLMDGIEATYKIRQRYDKDTLPIIAVTALSSELELQKCVDAGMNDTMTKPLSLNDVKMIMQKYGLSHDYPSFEKTCQQNYMDEEQCEYKAVNLRVLYYSQSKLFHSTFLLGKPCIMYFMLNCYLITESVVWHLYNSYGTSIQ